ncbi:MAG: hypothetical protein NC338_01865 [Firmicutes bacterium]|nr:hypothetical protein [Bacillota bacterium]MCM1401221.1 hypothetical protein [Bacteroides sp.]MCM1477082.1 hypothetical protein [Bacteroides sp.]
MKKTTYIIIAAVVLGGVSLSALTAFLFDFGNSKNIHMDMTAVDVSQDNSDSEFIATELEPFSSLNFTEFRDDNVRVYFNNPLPEIKIIESDTVTTPKLIAEARWKPFLKHHVYKNEMEIWMDFRSLANKKGGRVSVSFNIDTAIVLLVPRNKIDLVKLAEPEIRYTLSKFESKKLTIEGNSNVKFSYCTIDTIDFQDIHNRYGAYPLDWWLETTTIKNMNVTPSRLRLGTDLASAIDNLVCYGVDDTTVELDIDNAIIRSFRWSPARESKIMLTSEQSFSF